MTEKKSKTWLCPLCGAVSLKYGTTCTNYPACNNKLHITGEFYFDDDRNKVELKKGKSIGIAEIANDE